jgi:hypothetical protein
MIEKNDTVILLVKICDLFELTFVNDEIKYSKLGIIMNKEKKDFKKDFKKNLKKDLKRDFKRYL